MAESADSLAQHESLERDEIHAQRQCPSLVPAAEQHIGPLPIT